MKIIVLIGLLWGAWTAAFAAAEPRRPNIIVLFTDDQGYADLGCQGAVKDIRTPNLDRLAAEGVRCTAGYITAPQCSPSRAGLLTGRYQQRFGFDTIPDTPLPLSETTIADRLRGAGYRCGMVGKWHLEPNATSVKWMQRAHPEGSGDPKRPVKVTESDRLRYAPGARGFDEFFWGELHRFWANYDLDGNDLAPGGQWVQDPRYRLVVQTDAALAFIDRNRARPFFLYLAYFAPHTPLEATKAYLDRFPGPMPERRRYALAMLSAVDDGVGRILDRLRTHGLNDNTLIFFTSDNGAPLKLTRPDAPVNTDPGGWDGSLNDPWVGEKGMLTEGGIRVPFLVRWKAAIPGGRTFDHPVSSLDIAATAAAAAGLPPDTKRDGVDLVPYLAGRESGAPHDALFWRFWNQAAVRAGPWKYLRTGNEGEYLFNVAADGHETRNLLAEHPDVAARLREKLAGWCAEIKPPGFPDRPLNVQEGPWYRHYLKPE